MKREYGRTTITVPWELKTKMKKARSQVNWSAVACQAFEQKLDELGPIEEISSVEEAVKRMKNLQNTDSFDPADCQTGHEAGKHWAMNFARPEQLKRMEDFRGQHSKPAWEELLSSRAGWKELTQCIDPNGDQGSRPNRRRGPNFRDDELFVDPRDRPRRHRRRPDEIEIGHAPNREREVWRAILDRRPDHPAFFLGFANGALEVWEQIKDQF